MNRVLIKARCVFSPMSYEEAQHRRFAEGWLGVVDVAVESGGLVRTLLVERDGNDHPFALPAQHIIMATAYRAKGKSIAVDILFHTADENAHTTSTATVCVGGNQRRLRSIFEAIGHPL
jgi:hypothetical protein